MLKTLPLRLSRRPWRFLLPGLLLFFFGLSLTRSRREPLPPSPFYHHHTKSFFPPLRGSKKGVEPNYCENFPASQLENIQVVLKTSAGDSAINKAHLATVSSCIANIIVVSDHDEKIGDQQVVDILAELPASYAVNNTDFQAYANHRKAHTEGDKVNYSQQGWRLDKFKYLPMVDKAYQLNPKAKWYVFLEADVYIFWDTLFRLLDQLDSTEAHYIGQPAHSSDGWFASAGAGIVISQGLMKKLLPAQTGTNAGIDGRLSVRYEDWVKTVQQGDAILAYAIQNATGVKLEALYPTFSGHAIEKISVDRERWCVPLLSLHRLSPDRMESLWKWERTRPYNQKPFVYSSLLAYTHGHLRSAASREFWDNLSEAPVPNERPAHRNAESCGSECGADANCLQWSYSQTVCRFANYVKLGNAVDRENGGQGEFTCGWDTRKLGELGFKVDEESDMTDTCEEATWLTPVVR
ncbi:hypothetical protein BDV95DRAFT_612602 [Massariosphaeria phaeospora]|uniref:N-acetylgalactosaminide beta-1,3-galactosyltransferase n=1 Tax=Massariosphaeria phaeospora TaxID=100035 RepID=A0A7C8M037_9PLEO|nr:hypothetical protein BDV95DRAFT_612602 [Massariosphaeria phaeospora]